MTCIVGLQYKDGVIIGGDSAGVNGWDIESVSYRKVFFAGNFLIGYTTSFRMGQLLQYGLKVKDQEDGQSDFEYMVLSFIPAVKDLFSSEGFARIESNQVEGGNFLVGYKGKLYEITSELAIICNRDLFQAIGSGYAHALGSLMQSDGYDPITEDRVIDALMIADHFTASVCAPFYTLFQEVSR